MSRRSAFGLGIAVGSIPGAVLVVWMTGVGAWLGLWQDSVQWWRQTVGTVPGVCEYAVIRPTTESR